MRLDTDTPGKAGAKPCSWEPVGRWQDCQLSTPEHTGVVFRWSVQAERDSAPGRTETSQSLSSALSPAETVQTSYFAPGGIYAGTAESVDLSSQNENSDGQRPD